MYLNREFTYGQAEAERLKNRSGYDVLNGVLDEMAKLVGEISQKDEKTAEKILNAYNYIKLGMAKIAEEEDAVSRRKRAGVM